MSDSNNKPVIFLAFANDRDDTVGYLRNLPDEARRLRDVLESAEQAGLCEVVVRSNSTADDIFKVFQDAKYRNRIAIFHYGGHANGYQLLLETAEGQAAAADAGGLAAFLGQQDGLELVFLNGCSTQQQTEGLLDANVSAVISTSRAIDDQVATDFSCQFYQGLAGGASVRTAYNEAEAAVQTAKGGNTRGLYFGDADDPSSRPEADRWPWNLYLREGSENTADWNLPEAVDDPLFGLPPLTEQDLPNSPYRYLDWFTSADAEVFFGRGQQIRELYDRVTNPSTPPIVLFYGQSGVGKSSILDAGLLPRLSQGNEVVYLRRDQKLGLAGTLLRALSSESTATSPDTAWQAKEEQLGNKTLVVILDQVEELYTRPNPNLADEIDQLLRLLQATFGERDRRPRGKLVLSFRKEWLAELEDRLADDELPRAKVFLEPLDRRGIIEVVRGPARSERLRQQYRLDVEDGLAEVIADDLLEDRDSAVAPTLQILLTKMWNEATAADAEHPRLSLEVYQRLKRDGILLGDFLDQQMEAFKEHYPEAVESGLLLDLVALHTTPLGTADHRAVEQLEQEYAHLRAELPDFLRRCQDLHLLSITAGTQQAATKTTRLAHDTLAPLIRQRFENSDKPGQRARRILDNRAVDWEGDREGTPLDEADLKVVEEGLSGTRVFSPTEQRLMESSRQLKAKLERNRMILKVAGVLAVSLIAIAAGIATWQWIKADTAKKDAFLARDEAENAENTAISAREEADESFQVSLNAINGLLTEVSENLLLNEPGLQDVRKKLLDRARDFLDELKKPSSSEVVAYLKANILVAIGRLHNSLGSTNDALIALQDARTEVDRALPTAENKQRELSETLGDSWTETGRIHGKQNDMLEEATEAFEQALRVRQQLADDHAGDFNLNRKLANAHMNMAWVYFLAKDETKRTNSRDAASRIRDELFSVASAEAEAATDEDEAKRVATTRALKIRFEQAKQFYRMSQMSPGDAQSVQNAINEADFVFETVTAEGTLSPEPGLEIFEIQSFRAKSQLQMGNVLKSADKQAALKHFTQAIEILEPLVLENPLMTKYRFELGQALIWRGGADPDVSYQEAIDVLEPLLGYDHDDYTQYLALAQYLFAYDLKYSLEQADSPDPAGWEEVRRLLDESIENFDRVENNRFADEVIDAIDLRDDIYRRLNQTPVR